MGTVTKRPNGRWLVRYRTPTGREKERTFDRRVDAERWMRDQLTQMDRGQWVDWRKGRKTFGEYVGEWRRVQVHHRKNTATTTAQRLDCYILPGFAQRPLVAITRTEVQAWVAELATRQGRDGTLSPVYVQGIYRLLAQVFRAAVEDHIIAETPCRKISLPQKPTEQIVPFTVEEVVALALKTPERYRAAVWLAAGTGMRLGEVLGLTVDRVDFLRRTIRVDRQLQDRELVAPKTKASVRTIPVGSSTIDLLAAHMQQYPPLDGHFFYTAQGALLRRQTWHGFWPRVTERAGVPGAWFHDLRHFYASALIAAGLSVKVVQARLGHATAAETLDTYGHLWPDDDDRTRTAIEAALQFPREFPREPRATVANPGNLSHSRTSGWPGRLGS